MQNIGLRKNDIELGLCLVQYLSRTLNILHGGFDLVQ